MLLWQEAWSRRWPEAQRPLVLGDIRSVLVVRLDEIGDMVLTTPFLRELRRNLPEASITLVVRPAVHNLVALCPYVDRVLAYEHADSRPRSALLAVARGRRFMHQHFGTHHFDLAVAPRWDADPRFATVLAVVSGARWRLGYSERAGAEKPQLSPGLDRLLTHACQPGSVQHEVTRNLDLIRFVGGTVDDDRLELWLSDSDRQLARDFLDSHGVGEHDFLLAFAPGAVNPRRRWPIARFAEVADWSLKSNGGYVVVVGGEEDRGLSEALRTLVGPHVLNAAGQTTLRQAAALMTHCSLFLGNDSGPMHIAAASGLPVVEISCHAELGEPGHDNSPLRFGPWRVKKQFVVQPATALAPCVDACLADTAHCIGSISAGDVIAQAARLLSRPDGDAMLNDKFDT
ncbi:MAG: glycosyltransferase family 9 protein [Vicinamibacterales bacterium]